MIRTSPQGQKRRHVQHINAEQEFVFQGHRIKKKKKLIGTVNGPVKLAE